MRISITCEECGRRHRLARVVDGAEPLWIVCHGCEMPLRADLPSALSWRARAPLPREATAGHLWAGLFHLRRSEPAS